MCYDASFKLKVVELAKGTNNSEATRQHMVQIREWRKTEAVLQKMLR